MARWALLALAAALTTSAAGRDDDDELGAPWRTLAPGVAVARAADLGADPSWAARVLLFEPDKVRLVVRFDASSPTLERWRERYPNALAIANGSFFSKDDGVRPTCGIVSEGKLEKGASCHRQDALWFGALAPPFKAPATPTVNASAAGKHRHHAAHAPPAPRELPKPQRFFAPDDFKPEEWTEAMKSFPALLRDGFPSCMSHSYCTELSRTAALAQLRDGRLLLFASQWPAPRKDVALFLAEALGAMEALNLDGGPSATLALHAEPADEAVAAKNAPLPLVLLVLPAE